MRTAAAMDDVATSERVVAVAPLSLLEGRQAAWPWRFEPPPRRLPKGRKHSNRPFRKDKFHPQREIRKALSALKRAERRNAPQEVLREKYYALEAALALESEYAEQLELELFEGFKLGERDRLDRAGALRAVGKDPDPHVPWDASPESIRNFAEHFPDGMTFSEIAWVLGLRHKQHAAKIFQRAVAKVLRALGKDADEIREQLREMASQSSAWEEMTGT